MAMQTLRLRRALTYLSALHRSLSAPPTTPFPLPQPASAHFLPPLPLHETSLSPLSRPSTRWFSQERQYKLYKEGDEITEDTILFEGCDYNHWLITVDFPKDPKPSAEEMVATYERICAEGLNISIEEAKKRIYACSTTTYQGFQAVMSEKESEKFKDINGVVFVLPDSYIYPVDKEYGGDKYENGVITPRPPPVYARSTRRDRQPRYDRSRGSYYPPQQQNTQYNQQRPMQGDDRNFGSPQNFSNPGFPGGRDHGLSSNYLPQQGYVPPQQRDQMPMGNRDYASGGWDTNQVNRGGPMPPYQSNYNQGLQGNYHPQEQRGFQQGDQRNYGPVGQTGYPRDNGNYSPSYGNSDGQGANAGYQQLNQGEGQRFPQMEQQNTQGDRYTSSGQAGANQGRY